MEQRQARAEERLDDHDREIKDLKQRVSIVETGVTALEKDIAIILNDGSHTRDSISEIKTSMRTGISDLKEDIATLRSQREDDHFVKPLNRQEARYEKIWWGAVGAIIAYLMTQVIQAIG